MVSLTRASNVATHLCHQFTSLVAFRIDELDQETLSKLV